ncbi:hypothetical protein [Microbacterium sp. SGAir0570]|uniref:hypothetical protein n=1 Tax=Microbacterium sp. SGAir0570 TaxID=2070348 RepID=UPI0010F45507|nr:hypothetical protein [Microbacterium sp. SGAir0570]
MTSAFGPASDVPNTAVIVQLTSPESTTIAARPLVVRTPPWLPLMSALAALKFCAWVIQGRPSSVSPRGPSGRKNDAVKP